MAKFFLFAGVCRTKENVIIHCYAESRNLKSAVLAILEPSEATNHACGLQAVCQSNVYLGGSSAAGNLPVMQASPEAECSGQRHPRLLD